jgi:hypothetical protein
MTAKKETEGKMTDAMARQVATLDNAKDFDRVLNKDDACKRNRAPK